MSKPTAAGGAGVGPSRRTWDVEEYTSKARERDREDKERAQQNEERIRKGEYHESQRKGGQKPLPRTSKLDSLPQPTSHLQPRAQPLDLDKDVGKTLLVDNSGDSRRGAGYYCEVCRKTCKDSIGYLDHVNGRDHLRRLGQTTHVARSTVEQVRARIQLLRSQTSSSSSSSSSAKEYDFLERVKAIADAEREKKEERKRRKREERERKEAQREEERRKEMGGGGVEDEAMMSMMGFGGFGSSKK